MATVNPSPQAGNDEKPGRSTARLVGRLLEIGIFVGLFAVLYFNLFKGSTLPEIGMQLVNVLAVVLGIGFLIFIHELGHFLAAKWCDVKVETFSVGFGRALPGCQFRYGETLYKLGMFPIGGYVKMLGQTDPGEKEEDQEAALKSPRSYMNKPVGQRLFIISAGVVMNLLFGLVAFIYIYMVGKNEPAPYLGVIDAASPADRAGLWAGSELLRVDDETNPSYEDLFYASLLSTAGKTVINLEVRPPRGPVESVDVIPRKAEGEARPTIGVGFPPGLIFNRGERAGVSPALKGSPASKVPFRAGDRIIGVRRHQSDQPFQRLEHGVELVAAEFALRRHPIDVQVQRGNEVLEFTVQPERAKTLGIIMESGPIVSISPKKMPPAARLLQLGDRIIALNGDAGFDPVRLGDRLADAADEGRASQLTVQRGTETFQVIVPPEQIKGIGTWTESAPLKGHSPMPVPQLGIGYEVTTRIKGIEPGSPADLAGLRPGMIVTDIETRDQTTGLGEKQAFGPELGWPTTFWRLMLGEDPQNKLDLTLIVKDETGAMRAVKLLPKEDPTWFYPSRGFALENELRVRYAENIWDAMRLGFKDTKRFVVRIYLNLYGFLTGRISYKLIAGPVEMARATYNFAERGFNFLIHFLAMISINLAVVNFLPIPVLDGGHAIMLILEKLRGKPVNERIFAYATYAGLAFIICLMLFVTVLDLSRFAWFQKLFGG